MENKISLPRIYAKDKIPVTTKHIPRAKDVASWSHLKDLDLPEIDAKIGLLLGIHKASVIAIEELDNSRNLEILYRKSTNLDYPEHSIDDKREHSQQDKLFLDKVEKSIELNDGHYTVKLPFKYDDVVFPNNEFLARKRLESFKLKMGSDSQYWADYKAFMETIIDKGYAEPVPPKDLDNEDGRVWYIPHHGVYHPRKPGKLRVVFDCTASLNGLSLSKMLLSGPDLTNNLVSVLLRFRLHNIAIMADIESMFYQVRVHEEDCDILRFLCWTNGDTRNDPISYRMVVHLFGATSSPSCANAALKQTALDNEQDFDESVLQVIRKNFYVDDCLVPTDSEEEAIKLVKDVTSLCHRGGFNVTKWTSNSKTVLLSIPPEQRPKDFRNLDFDHEDIPNERALGVYWEVEPDELGYRVTEKSQPNTRRSILSTLSSLYDPLGLASPFILTAKILLQELCKQKYGWDEELCDKILRRWKQWLRDLPRVTELKLLRCYKPVDFGEVKNKQLDVFTDASDLGYRAVIFMRLTNQNDQIHCTNVVAKSRVAPLKKITVPRMELTAATVGVRLCKMVTSELGCRFDQIYFWTDSTSLLRYIFNETCSFHTYVSNRVNLREATSNEQWRYIKSKANPADIASRGSVISKLLQNHEWIKGPAFLQQHESEWPQHELNRTIFPGDPEVKPVVMAAVVLSTDVMDRIITSHSSWQKLKKTIGNE